MDVPQEGDRPQHFVGLLTAAHGKLLGYLMSLLGRRDDAEDVLQRTSVLMWQKFGTFEAGSDFVAWASTIAFYEARNFQRLVARSPFQFDERLLATLSDERLRDLAEQDSRQAALESCLEKLGPSDRHLLCSVYQEGMTVKAMASRIGRAPQTLYNTLSQIRLALAGCVERNLGKEGA